MFISNQYLSFAFNGACGSPHSLCVFDARMRLCAGVRSLAETISSRRPGSLLAWPIGLLFRLDSRTMNHGAAQQTGFYSRRAGFLADYARGAQLRANIG